MRIIAGEFRGRKLLPPDNDATRPITDRAKQSLFDILAPRIPGSRVYDCFAGTGSMGLECLSRGAAHVTFFETDRSAVARLRKNIDAVGAAGRSQVVGQDIFQWFRVSSAKGQSLTKVDLVFLDPPYRFLCERPRDLRELATALASSHLSRDGLVIFRHDAHDRLELSPLVRYDERVYGGMTIELLRGTSNA
jgi:16S rRNA (guanine(966)-N(2))-methyltransferase RsmD